MKKDKDPKAAKREAFMSFLEGPTGSSEIMADDGKKPSSDH